MATVCGVEEGSAANGRNGLRPRAVRACFKIFAAFGALLCTIAAASLIIANAQTHPQSQSSKHSPVKTQSSTSPKPNAISFSDVTGAAGIDFHLTCGSLEKRYIMETMCGGVAVFDYDNDGWMDIFLVNGSTLEDLRSGKCYPSKLYRNNHDGTFTDVSSKAGLNHCGCGFGAAVGDYDNYGWEDLYVTYLDGEVLFRNKRDGTFPVVYAKAGVC